MLWYSEFYNHYQKNEFFYLNHFRLIAEYLCSDSIIAGNNQSKEYQKNAFLSLIYLLTFREIDSQFCTPKSEEYKLAEQVVNKYKKSPVNLNIIPDKPLNEYFEELLKSKSSQKAIRDLVEVANKS